MGTVVGESDRTQGVAGLRSVPKAVPADRGVRDRIRAEAARLTAGLSRKKPLLRKRLAELGTRVLSVTGLDRQYLGFAMVAVSNEFWRDQFAAVPISRRLLLLPHCLRDTGACRGTYRPTGLDCVECGACELAGLKHEAEALGYRVLIADGTPVVVQIVLSGRADALLGVACLDSLDKAFERLTGLGVPHGAVPLLRDGCVDTEAELDVVRTWMHVNSSAGTVRTRTYLPLLRAAQALFEWDRLADLLAPATAVPDPAPDSDDPTLDTVTLALDWLRSGGKRFRPFITLGSYAALAQGHGALRPDADLSDAFPPAVARLALAIEILHKASLVHDDIEDDDLYRYGRQTLHRLHGVPSAINVGDYLVGLGYRLVWTASEGLGTECVTDIAQQLSRAHLLLCRGQGAELLLKARGARTVSPAQMQKIYALKTAPAFEAALYAGTRAAGQAGRHVDPAAIRPFCRFLGVAYQVANDLKDWGDDAHDKMVAGQDILSDRLTMLLAFATAGSDDAPVPAADGLAPAERIDLLRQVYEERGVFAKARALVEQYKQRAMEEASRLRPPVLSELLTFIVETIL